MRKGMCRGSATWDKDPCTMDKQGDKQGAGREKRNKEPSCKSSPPVRLLTGQARSRALKTDYWLPARSNDTLSKDKGW